jgi:hypothetical protein
MGNVRAPVILRLIAFAVALALAAGLSACSSGSGGARTRPLGTDWQLSGIVGIRWRIVEVRHQAASVTIPSSRGGYFALSTDGAIAADDTLNVYAARFTTTTTGFHVTGTTVSGVGYVGHDPVMLALIEGTQALTDEGADVTARRVGTELDLSVRTYSITATQVGSAAPQPSPSPPPMITRS